MSHPTLKVTGLRLERGDVRMIAGLTWQVDPGQHWVILGANGCGKTSLLKCLVGYMPASGGAIELLGKRFGECDWRDLRLHVGMVSSSLQVSIPPGEIAEETVISGRYAQLDLWHAVTRADRVQARRWLRFFHAAALAERPWAYLSQGERQKVLIGRALMAKPRLLILDEPCAGLDPVARAEFLDFLGRLAKRRDCPALVLVTHHVEEIIPAFSHVLVMRKGKALAQGPLRETLGSATLSTCFGHPLRLRRRLDRYELRLAEKA
jgi:iron complex transport system ATP-binding protein